MGPTRVRLSLMNRRRLMMEREAAHELVMRAAIRLTAATLIPLTKAPVIETDTEREAELARLRTPDGFRYFLPYWHFINRETGRIQTFGDLWTGQAEALEAMIGNPWLFLLKAGKLGFTELECAFDAWRLLFAHPNARVGLFSKELPSAKLLLGMVKFGLLRLPEWMRYPLFGGPGGETTISLILDVGPDDQRTLTSHSTRKGTAIDLTLTHAHLDELSHMLDPKAVWDSVSTVIAPDGSCHIVTRGAGRHVYTAEIWETCHNVGGDGRLFGHFTSWRGRPDRDEGWRQVQANTMKHSSGLDFFAPETAEDALSGDTGAAYIPITTWDRCYDVSLGGGLPPGDNTPCVMAADASVSGDLFAIVVATRHPVRNAHPAIRDVFTTNPREEDQDVIDFDKIEMFIRFYIAGGCPFGHPKSMPMISRKRLTGDPLPDCPLCLAADWTVPGHNVVQFTYDPYQLADVAQHLSRDSLVWADPFDQNTERFVSDGTLYQRAMKLELAHNGSAELRQGIRNATVKLGSGPSEDSKMRIIKREAKLKIDAAVAAGMAVKRVLDLNL
jgi:hypothetical protein